MRKKRRKGKERTNKEARKAVAQDLVGLGVDQEHFVGEGDVSSLESRDMKDKMGEQLETICH